MEAPQYCDIKFNLSHKCSIDFNSAGFALLFICFNLNLMTLSA